MRIRFTQPWFGAALLSAVVLQAVALPVGVRAAQQGPIVVQSVRLFKDMDDNCKTTGLPTTYFLSTDPYVNARVEFAQWQGSHRVYYKWYGPSGHLQLVAGHTSTDAGTASDCAWLTLKGRARANLVGRWSLHLMVDGRLTNIVSFTLSHPVPPTPKPQPRRPAPPALPSYSTQLASVICCPNNENQSMGELKSKVFHAGGAFKVHWTTNCGNLPSNDTPIVFISVIPAGSDKPTDVIQASVPVYGRGDGSKIEHLSGAFYLDVVSGCQGWIVTALG